MTAILTPTIMVLIRVDSRIPFESKKPTIKTTIPAIKLTPAGLPGSHAAERAVGK